MHLLAEISAKRKNFFEAAGALAECRASLRDTCDSIIVLRQHVRRCQCSTSGRAAQQDSTDYRNPTTSRMQQCNHGAARCEAS